MSCASLRGCARSGFGLTGCAISGPMLSSSFFLSRSMGHLMRSPIWTGQWNSWLRSTVLGRKRGIRIGEEPDRDGQYFHYLAMWLYARGVLGRYEPACRQKGIALAHDIHGPFVVPGRGVIWKMKEDLSGPYPGYTFGALDAFDGYV